MQGTELANMVAWRQEEKPNTAWARRYGGDFPAIIQFIQTSEETSRETSQRERRRFAPAVMPLVAFAALVIGWPARGSLAAALDYLAQAFGFKLTSWGWISEMAVFAAVAAITCAFGLWRYSGFGLRRAAAAGATILLLKFRLGRTLRRHRDIARPVIGRGHAMVVGARIHPPQPDRLGDL